MRKGARQFHLRLECGKTAVLELATVNKDVSIEFASLLYDKETKQMILRFRVECEIHSPATKKE